MVQGKYFKVLLSKVTVKPSDHCLDIGCGTGNVTAIVAKKMAVWSGRYWSKQAQNKDSTKNNSHKNLKFLEGTLFDIDLKEIHSFYKVNSYLSPWTQKVNWTYLKHSRCLLNLLSTFNHVMHQGSV